MKHFDDSAVSPVVGVMLMLVVTIIIAAVVSGFAGSMASDQSMAPQATLSCTPVIEGIEDENTTTWWPAEYPNGFKANNGLVFEHKGGDSFGLDQIKVQLQIGNTYTEISLADSLPTDLNCTKSDVTAYLMEVGSSDGYITPGDKFMLYADNCYISTAGKCLVWKPEGHESGLALFFNTKCEYKVVDRASDKVIQQGTFVLH